MKLYEKIVLDQKSKDSYSFWTAERREPIFDVAL